MVPHTAYTDMIENCANLSNGWAVLSVIDEFIFDNCDSKNDLIATLMEYVLEIYPAVLDLQEWEDILDVGYFRDLNKRFENPPLQYLYSYLEFLSETRFDCNEFRRNRKSKVIANITSDVLHSFESTLTLPALERVFHFLIAEDCIAANTPIADFIALFSEQLILPEKRVIWVKRTSTKQTYHPFLFELLNQVVSNGFNPEKRNDVSSYHRLMHCFVKPNAIEFVYDNLKSAFSAYSKITSKNIPIRVKTFSDNLNKIIVTPKR